MNALTITKSASPTMTSKEMAGLTEKRHDNVRRTIESLVKQGVIAQPQIEDGDKSANGVVEKLYLIGERDSYVVVAQLSPEFTGRLVDRWQELEAKAAQPKFIIPTTLSGALRLAADQADQIDALTIERNQAQTQATQANEQLTIQAPKVKALELIATSSDGSYCIRDASRVLQMQEKKLRQTLQERHWIYQQAITGKWFGHAIPRQKGYIEHKLAEGERSDSTQWHSVQVRITAAGIVKLAQLLAVTLSANDTQGILAA